MLNKEDRDEIREIFRQELDMYNATMGENQRLRDLLRGLLTEMKFICLTADAHIYITHDKGKFKEFVAILRDLTEQTKWIV